MRHKKFTSRLFVLIFVGSIVSLCCVTTFYATTFIEFTLKDLCMKSDHIIVAQVVSMKSYWNPDQRRIFTEIQLEVNDNIKGQFQKQDQLKLTVYGGTVNGITTIVVGAPRFTVGERSVLFLSERHSVKFGRNFIVVGLSQGKFNIFIDKETGEDKVMREQIEFPLQLEKEGLSLPLTNTQAITLRDFVKHTRTCLDLKENSPK
jgi:hypothetical protein